MDPLTHALARAAVALSLRATGRALWIGATAALAPDLDVLIRRSADPLLAIGHHRGFSHFGALRARRRDRLVSAALSGTDNAQRTESARNRFVVRDAPTALEH
jgi:hypothetical protein